MRLPRGVPWFIFAEGRPGEFPRTVMMGAGWFINWLVAEWIISRRHRRRPNVRVVEPQVA